MWWSSKAGPGDCSWLQVPACQQAERFAQTNQFSFERKKERKKEMAHQP
jgi:hypothetical protein